jgi:phosphate transport system permease protein
MAERTRSRRPVRAVLAWPFTALLGLLSVVVGPTYRGVAGLRRAVLDAWADVPLVAKLYGVGGAGLLGTVFAVAVAPQALVFPLALLVAVLTGYQTPIAERLGLVGVSAPSGVSPDGRVAAPLRWLEAGVRAQYTRWVHYDAVTRVIAATTGTAVAVALLGVATTLLPTLATTNAILVFGLVLVAGVLFAEGETAKVVMLYMTVSTVVILALITVFLVLEAIPAFQEQGLTLLNPSLGNYWGGGNYSLVPAVWGTLLSTLIAMSIAAPLGVAGALFISEMAPAWAREILKPGVEMLAGIPSIVYGFLGWVVFSTYLFDELQMPTLGSMFAVGTVIGIMALPTVVSVAEDAIDAVPDEMKDGSLALGATDWQTIKSVTIPAGFSGISAAVLLGVGRAVGETMAATVILAHVQKLPDPLYDVFGNWDTLTGLIASQYGDASGTQMSALFAAGVVLFVTVLVLSLVSQYVETRMERKLGGDA